MENIHREFRAYNDVLMKMTEYDFIIGFKNGEAEIIKNKWGLICKVQPQEAIQYMIKALKPLTGIRFFDEAAEYELISSILSVLYKHHIDIKPVVTGEQKI